MTTTSAPGRIISLDGKDFLFFGGTAYLGLPTNPAFQEILISNIRRWGTAYGSSRHSNVQLAAYDAGEQWLAKLTGAEKALTVSSGMLAGKLVVEALAETTDLFFHFPGAHAAIKAAGSLPFYVNGEINPLLQNDKAERVTLLTDAVPSGKVVPVNLEDINKISHQKTITLLLDESHSLGILGEKGGGIFSTVKGPCVSRKIMVASLGKAMGLTGGMIAGDAEFISHLETLDSFIGAAGMSPAFVQTLADGGDVIIAQQRQLTENLQYLFALLEPQAPVYFDWAYPLIYPTNDKVYHALYHQQILITHFDYAGGALNRIVVAAHHTREDLEKLAGVLNNL
jgi:7-keto-8-aminopelargonate synthetase-like enzyme